MIVSRALWCSLLGVLALACVLSACAGQHEGSNAPRLRAPTSEEATQASCYEQDHYDHGWRPGGARREAQCFRDDGCLGGLSQLSMEGRPICFKWAVGPDAPALRWSTSLTHPRLAADVPPPDSIYEGGFEETNDCLNEACTPQPRHSANAAPIYAEPDATSALVGTVPAGECVQPGDYRLRSAPLRGVVLEASDGFEAGDVIYSLAYQGEGFVEVWRRGETRDVETREMVVRWDAPPTIADPREGYWLWVARSNGEAGWAKTFRDSEACE